MSEELDVSHCEHEAARLLPWHISGRLSGADSARVHAHLKECVACAADEARERTVHAMLNDAPAIEYAPQPGLNNLFARIDELAREMPAVAPVAARRPATPLPRYRPMAVRWLAAAVIVQAIGLGVLGALVLWNRGNGEFFAPRYTTLSSPPPNHAQEGRARVVFAPRTTVAELQHILGVNKATIVAGPSEAGVYTVAVAGGPVAVVDALPRLRGDAHVLFAEPQAPELAR